MNRRSLLRATSAPLLATALAPLLVACGETKPQFKAIDVTGAEYARDFQLTGHDGRPRTLKDFRGKAVVVFFGYTHCPDVCPTTLSEIAEAKRLLGPDGARVQGVFVTVDPQRDTPEMLKAYMANFGPDFVALRGTPDELAAVAKEYKIYYKKVDGKMPDSYTMDHSAGSYVYDPQGRVRLYTRYGTGPEALASDLKILLKDA
ncbi:SCO family protein [Ramlibacter sp. RBP-2]|uniref:SCO family protein n=1 Tax=Ramlibacter lithotrophicus TaxID=2606681 RepID=A0A7X6DI96_9BURK|nr:SCO family protein [Ramlibacter lithotrophicus]NKE67670.1 SCO family protein [Ramlibacter lithotrophicus]